MCVCVCVKCQNVCFITLNKIDFMHAFSSFIYAMNTNNIQKQTRTSYREGDGATVNES